MDEHEQTQPAQVLVIPVGDPWQLSLYTTASWRAEPQPTIWAAFTSWQRSVVEMVSGTRPEMGERKMNNNKQSNRTHVDFFEYIEMSCVDNIIRSDKITSIPPSMI